MTESLFCTPKTNVIVSQRYFNLKIQKRQEKWNRRMNKEVTLRKHMKSQSEIQTQQ